MIRYKGTGAEASISRILLLRDSVEGFGRIFRIPPLRRVLLLSWMVPALAVVPEALAVPYAAELSVNLNVSYWETGLLEAKACCHEYNSSFRF